MQMEKYTKIRVLGKGSFGSAILIKRRSDNALLVIKEVFLGKMSKKEREEARHECRVLQQLSHPNIVRYVEHFENRNNLYIVMEYCDGGDLHAKVKLGPMKESTILYYYSQVCLAMEYLHSRHILHRDIKAMNVFLMKNGSVKLGDFGISTVLRNTMGMANTVCGTPYYFSPEICRNKPYNNKSDVWALGVLLYELATGKHPFDGNSMQQLMQRIVKGSYAPLPSHFSPEFRKMVDWCLQKDPSRRPSIRQTLSLPIIRHSLEQLEENLMLATQCKVRLKDIIDFEVGGENNNANNNNAAWEQVKQGGDPQRFPSPSSKPLEMSPGKAAALAMAHQQNEHQQAPQRSPQRLSPGAEAAVEAVAQRPGGNFALLGPKPGAAPLAVDHNRIENYRRYLLQHYQREANDNKDVAPAPSGNGNGVAGGVSPAYVPQPVSALPLLRQQPQQQPQPQQRNLVPAAVENRNQNPNDSPRQKVAGGGAGAEGFKERMQRVDAIMQRYAQNVDPKSRETIQAYMRRKQEEYLQRQKLKQERIQQREEMRRREIAKVIEHQNIIARGDLLHQQRQQQQKVAHQNPLAVQVPFAAANCSPFSPRRQQQQHAVFGRDPRFAHRPAKEVESPTPLQRADPIRNNNANRRRQEAAVLDKKKVFAANSIPVVASPKSRQHQSRDPSPREDEARSPQPAAAAAGVAGVKVGDKNVNMNRRLSPPPLVGGGAGLVPPTKAGRVAETGAPRPYPSAARGPPPMFQQARPQGMLRLVSAPVLPSPVAGPQAVREDAEENDDINKGKKAAAPTRCPASRLVRRSSVPLRSHIDDPNVPNAKPFSSPVAGNKQMIRPTAAAGFMSQGVSDPQRHIQGFLSPVTSPRRGLMVLGSKPSLVSKEDLPAGVEERRLYEQRRRQLMQNADMKLLQEERPERADGASLLQAPNTGLETPANNNKRRGSIGQLVEAKAPLRSDVASMLAKENRADEKPRKKEAPPPIALAPLQIRQMQPSFPQCSSPNFNSSPFKANGALPANAARAAGAKQCAPQSTGAAVAQLQLGIGQMPAVLGVKMPPQSREPPAALAMRRESFSNNNSQGEELPILLDIGYGFSSPREDGTKQCQVSELGLKAALPSITDLGAEQPDVLQQWRNVADNNVGYKAAHRIAFTQMQTAAAQETQVFSGDDDVLIAFQKANGMPLSIPSTLEVLRTLRDGEAEDLDIPVEKGPGVSLALLKQKQRKKNETNSSESQPSATPLLGLSLPIVTEDVENQLEDGNPSPKLVPSLATNSNANTPSNSIGLARRDSVETEERAAMLAIVDGINDARANNDTDGANNSVTSTDRPNEPSLDSYLAMLDHLRGLLYRRRPSSKVAFSSENEERKENEQKRHDDDNGEKGTIIKVPAPFVRKRNNDLEPLQPGGVSCSTADDLPKSQDLQHTKPWNKLYEQQTNQILQPLGDGEGKQPLTPGFKPSVGEYEDIAEEEIDEEDNNDDDDDDDDDDFEDALPLLLPCCEEVSDTYRRLLDNAGYLGGILASQEPHCHADVNEGNVLLSAGRLEGMGEVGTGEIIDNMTFLAPAAFEVEDSGTESGCTVTVFPPTTESHAVAAERSDGAVK
ncbi:protein kinase, putative,serine/threonine-protein kinase Nek1, putative [Trypanosoma cruzi marinkellei]|uniref:non-specific serine/threonine protein kinase n=1 Tax=Trypanosoma cruzi marinkellei TaxID=85056 RepID=K2N952_TRYCR|nr:protein kinase, putative,serine/threonine-protein kinase Nek1, putative [Trypanosoma cruzi marinkellei]